jgi:tetratricopeptide (TPR) repeat protein
VGERHPAYATCLNNLAALLQSQGDYAAARPLFEKALVIRKEALGDRHPDYATSLNNLATLIESLGDYVGARPLFEQSLRIRKAALGEHHPAYAESLNNLAHLLQLLGDYAAARPMYLQALTIRKACLGVRHPEYCQSVNNLALLLQEEGDYVAAKPLLEEAVATNRAILGENHPAYAISVNNLAALLKAQGDYGVAKLLYERALAIRKRVLSERHPSYATSLDKLASLLDAQGDYAAARTLYEQALAIRKDVLGEHHPDYSTSLNNLAALLQERGNYAEARPLYERSLAIVKETQGERHFAYASGLTNLAGLPWSKGDISGAASLLNQALGIDGAIADMAAATQSERQQLAMTRHLRSSLDAYLSLASMANLSPSDAYVHVLAAKGIIFERQQRIHALRRVLQKLDRPSLDASRLVEYEQTVGRLATMAFTAPDAQQANRWRATMDELARRKDELEAELARFGGGLRAGLELARRTGDQIRSALPKESALVDLLVDTAFRPAVQKKGEFQWERGVVAFVVRNDRPIARVDLGPEAPIIAEIDSWRALLIGRAAAPDASGPSRTLRRLIWEPLEPYLDGVSSVLVSPDGPIARVPLSALPAREANRYLVEERSIAVVPVPRMLGSGGASAADGQSAGPTTSGAHASLPLARDIDYGGDPWPGRDGGASQPLDISARSGILANFKALRETVGEIMEVRTSFLRHFPNARVDVLRGDQATKTAFKRDAPGHGFLHLATHGYFAPKELRSALGPGGARGATAWIDSLGSAGIIGYHPGLLSGLAFAGANLRPTPVGADDGILTALEVTELDLAGVELAV